jgi:hypothetical protein
MHDIRNIFLVIQAHIDMEVLSQDHREFSVRMDPGHFLRMSVKSSNPDNTLTEVFLKSFCIFEGQFSFCSFALFICVLKFNMTRKKRSKRMEITIKISIRVKP